MWMTWVQMVHEIMVRLQRSADVSSTSVTHSLLPICLETPWMLWDQKSGCISILYISCGLCITTLSKSILISNVTQNIFPLSRPWIACRIYPQWGLVCAPHVLISADQNSNSSFPSHFGWKWTRQWPHSALLSADQNWAILNRIQFYISGAQPLLIKKDYTLRELNSQPPGKKSHDPKLTISNCTMLLYYTQES